MMNTDSGRILRREFLKAGVTAAAACGLFGPRRALGTEARLLPPVRQITRGPKFHWFGYYDKLQFSPDNRFVLCNRVGFEHRSPTAADVIEVGMIDLQA